ncbi:hypothetical protein LguiA_018960 [Lonicera macranthoides]
MAKGGKGRSNKKTPKSAAPHYDDVTGGDMMDDEIDAFHKQRDVVPLDVNDDIGESDEDNEHPVFDFEGVNDDEDDDEDDFEDDTQLTGLAAKIARQQKYLRAKTGGVEDLTHDDAEDEEERRDVWGRSKSLYYDGDNVNYELQSSDEELPAEEEAEVLRLQKENAKSLSMEDFGLEDASEDESDGEPTLGEIFVKGKTPSASTNKEPQDETGMVYEEVKKDLNALSKEEQMDIVYSSAPELVGLLSELNEALEQLENKVNPLLSKVKERENAMKRGMQYMELKQLLLLSYCQAITFYLLLKSEGQPVRDHPVIARLVEIKNLLDKMKKLDENLPSDLEEILDKKHGEMEAKFPSEDTGLESLSKDKRSVVSAEKQVPDEALELVNVDSLKDNENKMAKRKRPSDQVALQSVEMLKVRAALEEKLKQKGVFNSVAPKRNGARKNLQTMNGKLETLDDFDDDAVDINAYRVSSNGNPSLSNSTKLSQLVTKAKKAKVISGDDDLPKRDDIGERRRRHELRVLAGAGIKSDDDDEPNNNRLEDDDEINAADEMEDDGGEAESESDLEFYKQVEKQHAAKLATKDEKYSRTPTALSLPDTLIDGKRHINYEMEKNRGLTRSRKKLTKNPRKKYRGKHEKMKVRRKGQVRDIKKPSGPYGGETSGINAGISRSIRFKS